MDTLKEMLDSIEYMQIEIDHGTCIHDAYKKALLYSAAFGCTVDFIFNDCNHRIHADSIIANLIKSL